MADLTIAQVKDKTFMLTKKADTIEATSVALKEKVNAVEDLVGRVKDKLNVLDNPEWAPSQILKDRDTGDLDFEKIKIKYFFNGCHVASTDNEGKLVAVMAEGGNKGYSPKKVGEDVILSVGKVAEGVFTMEAEFENSETSIFARCVANKIKIASGFDADVAEGELDSHENNAKEISISYSFEGNASPLPGENSPQLSNRVFSVKFKFVTKVAIGTPVEQGDLVEIDTGLGNTADKINGVNTSVTQNIEKLDEIAGKLRALNQ